MAADVTIRLGDGAHVVQFYDRDDDLVDVVVGYLAAALNDGAAVIVIATPAHRDAFDAALSAAGIGPAAWDGDGVTVLDAAETLSAFMVDGTPDPARFDAVVGEAVRRASATGRPVRAYGEMVAVLWQAGNHEAAVALEGLWNDLAAATSFSLFCAYPSQVVGGAIGDAVTEVCRVHSQVIGSPTTSSDADVVRRFVRSPHAPRLARRFVSETLLAWGAWDLVNDAAVVVTELTANAVTHAESDVTVSLARDDGRVRIAVTDRGAGRPVVRAPDLDALGGRGLVLVDHLASRWGHEVDGDGKVVWAELSMSTNRGG